MTQISLRATRAAALAIAAAALGACTSSLDGPALKPIGVLQVDVNGDVAATSTRPTVTFIRAYGLNVGDTRNPGDTCQVLTFSESSATPSPVAGVSAGDALSLALGGTTTQLLPSDQIVGRVYAPAADVTVSFTPGDSATVHIPGLTGGFPALDFSIKTAEPVIFAAPIPVPAASSTSDLTVKWNAGDANSAMLLSLRYQATGQATLNQLLCLMRDDGEFSIPNARLAGWQATTSGDRTAVATRVRNNGINLDGATFFGSTTFRKTIPLAP